MYEIQASTKFRRDLKKLIKQQKPIEKLKGIIQGSPQKTEKIVR